MCPWREPDEDRAAFFPGADRHDTEVVILSGLRPELSQRLGRAPTAAENALHLHRIFQGERLAGQVAVRRVKGESGAIELVLATGTDGVVRGVRIQRQREPEATMQALDAAWLDGFRGKSVRDVLAAGRDLPEVPGRARASAAAIADGVRSELILLDVAASPRALRRPAPEANPRSHH